MNKTYLLEHKGEIFAPRLIVNPRGFYKRELLVLQQNNRYKNCNVLCVEDEVEKYHLNSAKNSLGLNQEVFYYKLWFEAYLNNNINGFSLPIIVNNNDEYKRKLEETLSNYIKQLNRPAFIYNNEVIEYIKKENKLILSALDHLINNNSAYAETAIKQILNLFKGNSFFISTLDKSYSFRGIAPFKNLQNSKHKSLYDKTMNEELTFFRVRTKRLGDNNRITEINHILHLPYDLKSNSSSMRFTPAGSPGLYLGTSSYDCIQECNWNKKDELYAAAFIPNFDGKNLKILNLTISQALINGIYTRGIDKHDSTNARLQNEMLKIFPLVIATSFSVKNTEKIKYHYLLSQTLMKVALENGIDGIAYLSMKGENEFQYPQGVNLVLPAIDISPKQQYSKKCSYFKISKPVLYCNQTDGKEKSYINKCFTKDSSIDNHSVSSQISINGEKLFYSDTAFGKFDNYLVSNI